MWIILKKRRNLLMTFKESGGDYFCKRKLSNLSGMDKNENCSKLEGDAAIDDELFCFLPNLCCFLS